MSQTHNQRSTLDAKQVQVEQSSEDLSQQPGGAVVLRWRPSNRVAQTTGASTQSIAEVAAVESRVDPWLANPLRDQSSVRQANFQQTVPGSNDPFQNPFGDKPPSLPQNTPQTLPPATLPPMNQPADPLSVPESAPAPDQVLPNEKPKPFPDMPSAPKRLDAVEDPSPFDRRSEAGADQLKDDASELALPSRKNGGSTVSCDERRQRVRSPLTSIDLNSSPRFGEGLATDEDREKDRLDFAASSVVRDWADYQGNYLATGRMIDLRNERVLLDDNGVERCLPLRDLSDADAAYVGRVWNLPISCGTGYEPYIGRDHIASSLQYKASGLCHKPLYFEEIGLERYGHEVGPVLQPLISSVHFFGNIAILPYKMGIHPMTECQYSLGYYRPGSCSPYMIPPVPLSLRGALSQARVVVGGAALIP